MKNENHIISISLDEKKKVFHKVRYPLVINMLEKLATRGILFNITKIIKEQLSSSINRRKSPQDFSLRFFLCRSGLASKKF